MDNTLYFGDNLDILRTYIKDESIDLIYLDPPFNSKRNYNILFSEQNGTNSTSQIRAFDDTWKWGEQAERTFLDIREQCSPKLVEMLKSFVDFIGRNDVTAYLTMMAIRLVELRRVLKSTGSIYLHCDPTASHYLKILMDLIFDGNFRNEIIWHYRRWTAPSKKFQRLHDIILFYSKTDDYKFNIQYIPYTGGSVKRKKQGVLHRFKEGEKPVLVSNKNVPEKGVPANDVWMIPFIAPSAKERLG